MNFRGTFRQLAEFICKLKKTTSKQSINARTKLARLFVPNIANGLSTYVTGNLEFLLVEKTDKNRAIMPEKYLYANNAYLYAIAFRIPMSNVYLRVEDSSYIEVAFDMREFEDESATRCITPRASMPKWLDARDVSRVVTMNWTTVNVKNTGRGAQSFNSGITLLKNPIPPPPRAADERARRSRFVARFLPSVSMSVYTSRYAETCRIVDALLVFLRAYPNPSGSITKVVVDKAPFRRALTQGAWFHGLGNIHTYGCEEIVMAELLPFTAAHTVAPIKRQIKTGEACAAAICTERPDATIETHRLARAVWDIFGKTDVFGFFTKANIASTPEDDVQNSIAFLQEAITKGKSIPIAQSVWALFDRMLMNTDKVTVQVRMLPHSASV